jgi:hypothetical protein
MNSTIIRIAYAVNSLDNPIVLFLMVGVLALVGFFGYEMATTRTELKYIRLAIVEIKEALRTVAVSKVIDHQTMMWDHAGEHTISNLNITAKLTDVLLSSFDLNELKRMASDLNMDDGNIQWSTRLTAVNSILKIMERDNRLISIVQYISKHRPHISL